MKKNLVLFSLLFILPVLAQDHFLVLRPLKGWNYQYWHEPLRISKFEQQFEVQTLAAINVSNNKVGFKDIVNGDNLENKFSKEMALLILT
jgi:hypothetical protein